MTRRTHMPFLIAAILLGAASLLTLIAGRPGGLRLALAGYALGSIGVIKRDGLLRGLYLVILIIPGILSCITLGEPHREGAPYGDDGEASSEKRSPGERLVLAALVVPVLGGAASLALPLLRLIGKLVG